MAKKFNLAEFLPEPVSDSDPMTIREIPLPKIIANGRNLYGVRDVEDLADSIALNGLLEPLIVYPYGSSAELYRVISGHRRLAALQLNKAQTAPCRVVDAPKSQAWEDLLIINANKQRVKTGAEQAAEAERMTAALVALKKDGVEIPGRLRDVVADAMGTSSTSLARKKVIQKQLIVPGFKQAWEAGKMGETVAYELARLPEKDQYAALDLLIDAGVDYKTADIKTVQKIKRRVEQGESPAQDLAAAAEKLGIQCPEGDYSPLLSHLVWEAIPKYEIWDVLECRTKAAGVEALHKFGFSHHSSSGGAIWFDSDPQALHLKEPICRRIKWADVWELLALHAMQKQAVELPAEDERKPAPVKLKKDVGPVPEWMTGEPTREGRYICRAEIGEHGVSEYTSCEWKDGGWWVFDRPALSGFEVVGWWPLPDKEE